MRSCVLCGLVPFPHVEAVSCLSVFGSRSGLPHVGNGAGWVAWACMGLYMYLWLVLPVLVLCGTSHMPGWARPGLPGLNSLAGPMQYFSSDLPDAQCGKVSADLCGRKGFRGGSLLGIVGSQQLLDSSHVRERDKALLFAVSWLVGYGVGFLLIGVRGQPVPCRFCGNTDKMAPFCENILILLLLSCDKIMSFMVS